MPAYSFPISVVSDRLINGVVTISNRRLLYDERKTEGISMGDEELYLVATKEANSDARNPALWAKALALAEGDEEKAKYQYIKLRAGQLSGEVKENTQPDDVRTEGAPYPWKTVLIWVIAIFIAGFVGTRPPEGVFGNTAIGFKIVFALVYSVIIGLVVGVYKYFRR